MTVVAVVPNAADARLVYLWANNASDGGKDIEYVCFGSPDFGEESGATAALKELGVGDDQIRTIWATSPVNELLALCRDLKAKLLVTGDFSLKRSEGRPQNTAELIRAAPCMTMAPIFGRKGPAEVKRVLAIVRPEQQDVATLRLAQQLCERISAKMTVATVEGESGPKAERAGVKAVQNMLNDAGLDEDDYEIRVAVDGLHHRGILQCYHEHDAIVCGQHSLKAVAPLRQSVGDATAIVVKRPPPLRLRALVDWLPQINPRDHADLLQDLRAGSQWNRDFVSMLGLAAAIASLGLMQNSAAVVIGSMLLAPLMTPMIGMGLALAQSNVMLARQCGKTILMGVLLTLAVSALLGMVTPSRETLSPEILTRGQPNVLDLLIALGAAVAATIAMSRPNISGAIAGVAIATALVPPLCSVGLSLAHGSWDNSLGALLLFSTNLVAIILASTITFRLIGILPARALPRHRRAVGALTLALVVALIAFAGPLNQQFLRQLEKGRDQVALYPITRALARALQAHAAKDPDVEITLAGRAGAFEGVIIHIASKRDLPETYADELRAIVRNEMADEEMPVFVVCLRGQWLNTDGATIP